MQSVRFDRAATYYDATRGYAPGEHVVGVLKDWISRIAAGSAIDRPPVTLRLGVGHAISGGVRTRAVRPRFQEGLSPDA